MHRHLDKTRFSIFSTHATSVQLHFFNEPEATEPEKTFELERLGDLWAIELDQVKTGQLYLYKVYGPYQPLEGKRYNSHQFLLDPWATELKGCFDWTSESIYQYDQNSEEADLSLNKNSNSLAIPRCVVSDPSFDWEGDVKPDHPWSETILYETHLAGFTRHFSSKVKHPGTYRGFIEKIPYIKSLGITAVELLPIHEFEGYQHKRDPGSRHSIRNFWGYNTISYFSPCRQYASESGPGANVEFKQLVQALHRENIEVILDVVFNHSAESDELGPTFSFRGIDNEVWYLLDNQRLYQNHSGCGNTLNVNHPLVCDFILSCLDHWVRNYHIDGFRFDLGAVFSRNQHGQPEITQPIIEKISNWAEEHNVKLISEPWDASGLYTLGSFPPEWHDWNGQYRDVVRKFWKGEEDLTRFFCTRIMGSSDIFHNDKDALNSINFMTAHDGFTLNDLVSYSRRHNLANGENGNDGEAHNHSANWGVEGATSDATILRLRDKMKKNFLLTLFLSRGVPMLLAGDEFSRTQQGNNNAYCQDNEISWINWNLCHEHEGLIDFTRQCIAFKKSHPTFFHHDDIFAETEWFNQELQTPDWENPMLKHICCHKKFEGEAGFLVIFNSEDTPIFQKLPTSSTGNWLLLADTSLQDQAFSLTSSKVIDKTEIQVKEKSIVLLKEEN